MNVPLTALEQSIREVLSSWGAISDTLTLVTRYFFPLAALAVFLRCLWPLMSGGRRGRPWACLEGEDGRRFPLVHWENTIGRSRSCDVVLEDPSVSRTHAVIARNKDGEWTITDLRSMGGVTVGGIPVTDRTVIREDSVVCLADSMFALRPTVETDDEMGPRRRTFAMRAAEVAAGLRTGATLLFILFFQIVALVTYCISMGGEFSLLVPVGYLLFILLEVFYYIFTRGRSRRHIEPELLAFFLCGIGLFVAGVDPVSLVKQVGAVVLGIALFGVLTFFLNNVDRARSARYVFAAGAVALLCFNLLFGQVQYGARNWISVAGISVQPSEFVKVAFVFAGASSLDRLLGRRNLLLFLGFSGVCVGSLVLMRDFGSAAVFFMGFLVIAFMRSGNVRFLLIVTAVVVVGAVIAVSFLPYIQTRFSSWGRAWELASEGGYQQTRTMIYTASGGLFGVGVGDGYLRTVAAADTDLVFGVVAEEWGLIVALLCALAPLMLTVFATMSVKSGRSAFYAIAACGAAVILLAQTAFNVFGSLDILPLTGVTLPFVSNGGSSMVACWGLLACIKSIDERHRAAA